MRIDAATDVLAQEIKTAVQNHFGAQLDAVYLFGSRARGEHRPDSDLDVAVVLRDVRRPLAAVDRELLDITYPLEIARGLHLQAWAVPLDSMSVHGLDNDSQDGGLRLRLAATVRREGVKL
ncbi:MAG TPA: nucleotidyltransferase domain-containing protein [Rhizomicrobium sp.]|jgi:predicted nucleotidyltransferase